jgi:hypothetical protein
VVLIAATVAVANKNGRIIWAVLRTGEPIAQSQSHCAKPA